MSTKLLNGSHNRRNFLKLAGLGAGAGIMGLQQMGCGSSKKVAQPVMQGFEIAPENQDASKGWVPVSDRKLRIGIVGGGFGSSFYFNAHPNCIVEAVSDLQTEKRERLMKVYNCSKSYESLEELVKDDNIEAVFVATDAPSHMRHVIDVLNHGKHVASAVPAVWGSLEQADQLYEAVVKSGLKYMMFETSFFHQDLYAMRQIYRAGGFGKIVYSEGEYYHYAPEPIGSYKEWRVGVPPQWYPTHSDAYYVGVHDGSFTDVSCLGLPSIVDHLKPENNVYKNPFGTEIALFRTSEGGMSRMAVSWDTPGYSGEMGRIRGQRGSYYGKYEGLEKNLPDISRPPLPPGVTLGGHGGSHGYLMNEFILSIIEDRKPLVDVAIALNMTVAGIVAHQSALKNGEWMKIPQYKL